MYPISMLDDLVKGKGKGIVVKAKKRGEKVKMHIDAEFQNITTIPHNKPTIDVEEIKAAADTLSNLEQTVGTKVKENYPENSKEVKENSGIQEQFR